MKPNILLIQADQWHPRALSARGHPNVRTPNLDRLAAQGALFTDATCNQPLCMPSRISMLEARVEELLDKGLRRLYEMI